MATGLKWLTEHRNGGHWNSAQLQEDGKCKCGQPGRDDSMFGTALAVLVFQGAGHTHRSKQPLCEERSCNGHRARAHDSRHVGKCLTLAPVAALGKTWPGGRPENWFMS